MNRGQCMTGPELDPMRAFCDPPTPCKNAYADQRDLPTPQVSPQGPVIVGLIPSADFREKYLQRDKIFLAQARAGIFSHFLSSFELFLILT